MRLWMLSKAVFQHAYNKVSHDFFLTKEMIGVKNKQWIYKVGGRPQGLILSLFVFVLFGGMTFYFYLQINRHGAFLFGFLLAILVLFLIFFSVFRGLFIKVLIAEDGFYHQTNPEMENIIPMVKSKKHGEAKENSSMVRRDIFVVLRHGKEKL